MSRELLFSITKKDLDISYFSGKGGGGQHRNRHMNCVRIKHKDSGVTVTGQSNKERLANIREAFNNLRENPYFKLWFNRKVQEVLTGKTIEQIVEEQMKPENLRIEGRKENKWEILSLSDIEEDSQCSKS